MRLDKSMRSMLVLFIGLVGFFSSLQEVFADTVTVEYTTVNVRSGPGLDYEVIHQVHKGDTYVVLHKENNWIQIQLNDQQVGWIADWLVKLTVEEQKTKNIYLEANVPVLNVRTGPSTTFSIIDKIGPGKQYPLLESEGQWGKIELSQDKSGWVSMDYANTIEKEEKPSSSPAPQTNKQKWVMVNANNLNFREKPSLEAQVLQKLSEGTKAIQLSVDGDWINLQLEDGKTGWVFHTYVSEIENSNASESNNQQTTDAKIKIITQGTNLRKAPSTKAEIVQKGNVGEEFPIIATEGDWFLIDLGNNKTAYVAGWVVSAIGVPNIERNSISNSLTGKVIVVDAGHGGGDRGAEGVKLKTKEKDVNLLVASLVAKKLEAAGAKVVMTRSDDTYLSLQGRVDVATKYKADAFISIHHNSYKTSDMNGTMTFYYTAKKEKKLAEAIHENLVKQIGLRDLGVRKGDYYVLRENPQPSVLVEIGFLSNANEEAQLRSSTFQEKAAEGIFLGIVEYFKK